jgi:feruloyl esterase
VIGDIQVISGRVSCGSLAGLKVAPEAIGLPTQGATVLAANAVSDKDASGAARSFCAVTGEIHAVDPVAAPIRFQVNLPQGWNQRMLQFGGGGTNGRVVTGTGAFTGQPSDSPTALARGYVTLGSDSGHNADKDPPFDTRFGLNQEQLLNFGQWQIKKTLDVARQLATAMYGRPARFTYFAGGSQGGHEGFDAAQRYPQDYNGVIAQYPAWNVVAMHMGSQAQARAIYGNRAGQASASWMNPAKVALIVRSALSACDSLDGAQDGLVSNVATCNKVFTANTVARTLRCAGGADAGDHCLSDTQLDAVRKISSSVRFNFAFAGGSTEYPRWPLLEGGTFLRNHLGMNNTAQNPPVLPSDREKGSAFQLLPAAGTIKAFITRDMGQDALAFEPDAWVSRIQQVSGWIDASSADLSAFASRGGKLLLTHGTADDSITPHNTSAYWQRLLGAMGKDTVAHFARFYLIPGYGHGDGPFKAETDWLATLEAWVERGEAPQKLVARDGNTAPATEATNGRTRPLCEYPAWPRYSGTSAPTPGQLNDALHYECTAP